MKKTILLGSVACVLAACGLASASEVTAQQTPEKSVVEGGLTYTDHTGQQIGTLKGEDVKGLVLMAIDNNMPYQRFAVLPREPLENGVAVIYAYRLNAPDARVPNRYMLGALEHLIERKLTSACDAYTVISCKPDTAWLTVEPSTGLIRFEQKNAKTYQKNDSTDLPVLVSGTLSTYIRPNALVFQRDRFPRRTLNSSLTTSAFGDFQVRNAVELVMPYKSASEITETDEPDDTPRPILTLNNHPRILARDAQHITLDPLSKKVLDFRSKDDRWYCIERCDYQVSMSNTMTNIRVDDARLKSARGDQPILTLSGVAIFDSHQSQIHFKNLNFNVMYTNVNTFVENDEAYYRFEQEHLANDSACSNSSVQIWREQGIIQKVIVSCELLESTFGGATASNHKNFECGLPNTPTCTGASLSADGHTFTFVKTKLSNDEELNGTLYFAGVAAADPEVTTP